MTTSRALNLFLRSKTFKRQIVREYERFEVLAEGGLRTAVARLIRSKLRKLGGSAERYSVTCEARLGKVRPDILIWRGKHPRFWIELKDTGTFNKASAEADWQKLRKYLPLYSTTIKGGFLIYVARRSGKRSQFQIKRDRGTRQLWPIPIVLKDEMGDRFKAWNDTYKKRAHYQKPALRAKAASAS